MATTRRSRRFTATVEDAGRGRLRIALPFDADVVWGAKPRHHVGGTLDGQKIRASIDGGERSFVLGAAWARDCGVAPGTKAEVELVPEGPQAGELGDDLRDALAAEPGALAFFEGLAQFYRKAYVRYVDATKRSPALRAERIAEVVALCAAGVKERPKG